MAKRKRTKSTTSGVAAPVAAVSSGSTGFASMRWDQMIVWVCLHALLFLVPVAMSNLTFLGLGGGFPLTYDQFDIPKVFVMRALALIALGAWGTGMLLHGGKLRRTRIDWFILGFLVWVLISSFFSIHIPTAIFGKYRRFEGLFSFMTYALVYFLIVQVADRSSRIRSLARTLTVSSVAVTAYSLLQYTGRDLVQWGTLPFEKTRSFATYGNPDLLGGFLVLALPVAFALALSESSRAWKVFYWIASFMLSAVMITAFTRGAWIGGFVAMCVLGWAVWRARVKTVPLDWGFFGAAVLAVVAIVIRSLNNPDPILNFSQRFVSIFQFGEGSAASRFEIWKAAIEAVKMEPIVGFGADTFRLVFPFTKTEAYVQQVGYLSVADNVHNYPLQLMAGIGIPGFLIMYGVIAYALTLGAPFAFGRDTGSTRLLQAGVWASVIGYVFHLMFGLSVTGSTVIMWAMMALMMAPTARTVEVPRPQVAHGTLRTVAAVAVIAGVLVLSVMNIRYIVADRNYLMGRIGPYSMATRAQLIERAIALNPYNDMYRAELGLQYQGVFSQLIGKAQQERSQGVDPSQTIASAAESMKLAETALLDTIAFVPPEYDNYVFLASLYNLAGEYLDPAYTDKAVEIARRGVEVEFYGPAIRFQLARALVSKGLVDEAITELEAAVRFDPNYLEAKSLLGSLLIDSGRTERARQVLEEVLAVRPDDGYVMSELRRLAETGSAGASESPTP